MSVSLDKDSAVWTHIRQEIGGGGVNRIYDVTIGLLREIVNVIFWVAPTG